MTLLNDISRGGGEVVWKDDMPFDARGEPDAEGEAGEALIIGAFFRARGDNERW